MARLAKDLIVVSQPVRTFPNGEAISTWRCREDITGTTAC